MCANAQCVEVLGMILIEAHCSENSIGIWLEIKQRIVKTDYRKICSRLVKRRCKQGTTDSAHARAMSKGEYPKKGESKGNRQKNVRERC